MVGSSALLLGFEIIDGIQAIYVPPPLYLLSPLTQGRPYRPLTLSTTCMWLVKGTSRGLLTM